MAMDTQRAMAERFGNSGADAADGRIQKEPNHGGSHGELGSVTSWGVS